MANVVLIHGYAAGLKASVFRKPFGEHSGFVALDAEVKSGIAKCFRWSKNISLTIGECPNPLKYFRLYRDEELLAESSTTQSALREFLDRSDTTTIICHSLGCRLMIGTMNTYGIPESVTKIIFLQGDVPTSATITNSAIRDRIANRTLIIKNYFCPWDQSLLTSAILHRTNRIGLMGWNEPGVTNVFYPLLKPMNLHTSPMRDREFLYGLITK
ncbi:MAG: hypothetical protein AAB473_04260 [Patescibacteria group bacterium]